MQMAEKTTSENFDQRQGTVPTDQSLNDGVVKPKINGGLQAWMTVVALFCVFVNSWYDSKVEKILYNMNHAC